jgi:molecular chaperone GrpE
MPRGPKDEPENLTEPQEGAREEAPQDGGDGGARQEQLGEGSLERLTEDELREEVRALGTKWKRALADLENYKKRVERERRRKALEAREDLLLSLVEIADDFERAVAYGADSGLPEDDPYRAGVELTLKRVLDVLERHGVRPIETVGSSFDPAVHEAVAHVESPDHGTDEIIEEISKGYMVDDRPLRCARVVVAK